MNFRDFVKEDNKRTRLVPTEPEEEYFEDEATEEVEDLDEDTEGDFVEEDEPVEYYEEPAPRPAPRPAPSAFKSAIFFAYVGRFSFVAKFL